LIRALLVLLFLLAVTVLQTTIGPAIGISGAGPDMVLVMVLSWGLVRGSEEGMLWGLMGGLCLDLVSGSALGMHTLILVVVGYLAGLAPSSPLRSSLLLPLAAMCAATLAYDATIAVVLRVTGWQLALGSALARVAVPSMLANCLLMLIVYPVVSRLFAARGGLRPEF
jgi:rod shape-determining protein MreD